MCFAQCSEFLNGLYNRKMKSNICLRSSVRKFQAVALVFSVGLSIFSAVRTHASDDLGSISCSSSPVTAPLGGGNVTAEVICAVNVPNANSAYRITPSSNSFMSPNTAYLSSGPNSLTAVLQPSVTSPDNTVTSISGTSSGFTGQLSSSSTFKTLHFQYSITTARATPSGTYVAPIYYRYQICTTPSCNQGVFTGTATTNLYVNVPTIPLSVSCASPQVTANPGGGPFSLDVLCTLSGGSANKLSPSIQNMFSPSNITLSNGIFNLTAMLQPTVTSPDSSVSGITGTAGGGFTANINALPAKIQIQYQGTTTTTTPAGTYTSTPVLFTWSTL